MSEKTGIKFELVSTTFPFFTLRSILPQYLPCEPDDHRSVSLILIPLGIAS